MKIALLNIIILLIISSGSCKAQKSEILKTADVLIEVYSIRKGDVYPPGEILELKLFESGDLEYDYYLPHSDNIPFRLERRSARLDKDELKEFKDLVNYLYLSNVRSKYLATEPAFDASITTTLILEQGGRKRKFELSENDVVLLLDKKKDVYPETLFKLISKIENVNQMLLTKKQGGIK